MSRQNRAIRRAPRWLGDARMGDQAGDKEAAGKWHGSVSGRVAVSSAGEAAVDECVHDLIEWEQSDEDMHCLGWICRACGYYEIGEYHHRTGCREDFCG